ncbi:MAG UNVERIFIED_CONTAM: hypothetical protein LVT10_13370 [Anaerolineae bacterium]|jgi:hypothetical protein
MRFLIDFSLVLGYTLLDQCDVALGFLRNLAKSGRLDHPVYFTWLAPILALWASKLGAAQLAQSLYRFHRASFFATQNGHVNGRNDRTLPVASMKVPRTRPSSNWHMRC